MEPALRNLTNIVTTCLDVVGLLALAAGFGAWSVGHIDGRGLAVAGAIVLAGSWYFARLADPTRVPVRTRLATGWRWLVAHWPHPILAYRRRTTARALATAARAGGL